MNVWSGHPSVDLILGGFVIGVHCFVVYRLGAGNVVAWANQSQRLALYAAGAGMMALIAGFTGTAIAQYGSAAGPIVTALRSVHGMAIRRNWLSITRWLLICTCLCLLAMAIDTASGPRGSEWTFEVALAVAVTKFMRLLFLFGVILSAVDVEVDAGARERAKPSSGRQIR